MAKIPADVVTWIGDPDGLADRGKEHQRQADPVHRFNPPLATRAGTEVATGRLPLYKPFQLGDALSQNLL
jgi:hypothetical protein